MKGVKQFIFVIGIILNFCSDALAQNEVKDVTTSNTFFFEVLGNAYVYSFNYERIFVHSPKMSYSARIGVSSFNVLPSIGGGSRYRIFPLTFNIIRHFDMNNLEAGIGGAHELSDDEDGKLIYKFIPTLHIGYRRYMRNNLDFRAGVNLSRADLTEDVNYEILPWPYLSFGKRF